MKKLTLLIAGISLSLNAMDSIGIYYPNTISSSYDGEFKDEDYDFETSNSGFGLIFKHAKEEGKTFTESIEYTKEKIENVNVGYEHYSKLSDDVTRINFIFTIQNDIKSDKDYNIWIAPRFNIAGESYDADDIKRDGLEIGIAPVVGIDYKINETVSVGLDVDYQFAYAVGSMELGGEDDSYKETRNRLSSRFYLYYRF